MKVKCKTSDLSKAFQRLKVCCGSGISLPILGSFLLEADEKGLSLTATDLELSVWLQLKDMEVVEAGSCCVVRRFADFLGKVKAEEVELALEKNQLKLSYSSGSAKFPTFPVEDFPEVKFPKSSKDKMVAEQLEAMMRVGFAAEKSQDRGFDCVFCGQKTFSTDGRRLAHLEFASGTEPFAVSVAHLGKVSHVFGKEKPLEFGRDKSRIVFCSKNLKASVQLREREAPNMEDVLGGEAKTLCKVERLVFLDMLERLVLINSLGRFGFGNGAGSPSLNVKVRSEGGEAEEKINVESISGAEQVIGINLNFMIEALKRMEPEVVEVKLTGAESPVKLEGEGLKCIVMPVKLDT